MTTQQTAPINWYDPKFVVAFCVAVFSAGGAWVSIAYIGDDVAKLEIEIAAETDELVQADIAVTAKLDEMADDVQRTAENMARVCQALNVDCR